MSPITQTHHLNKRLPNRNSKHSQATEVTDVQPQWTPFNIQPDYPTTFGSNPPPTPRENLLMFPEPLPPTPSISANYGGHFCAHHSHLDKHRISPGMTWITSQNWEYADPQETQTVLPWQCREDGNTTFFLIMVKTPPPLRNLPMVNDDPDVLTHGKQSLPPPHPSSDPPIYSLDRRNQFFSVGAYKQHFSQPKPCAPTQTTNPQLPPTQIEKSPRQSENQDHLIDG